MSLRMWKCLLTTDGVVLGPRRWPSAGHIGRSGHKQKCTRSRALEMILSFSLFRLCWKVQIMAVFSPIVESGENENQSSSVPVNELAPLAACPVHLSGGLRSLEAELFVVATPVSAEPPSTVSPRDLPLSCVCAGNRTRSGFPVEATLGPTTGRPSLVPLAAPVVTACSPRRTCTTNQLYL